MTSLKKNKVHLIKVVNLTPDSFSDGGVFFNKTERLDLLADLQDSEIVEFGADSTRPGSVCVGSEVEIDRLKPVMNQGFLRFSVDTHFAATAAFAIQSGAVMINDISAGADPEMFSLIAKTSVKYIMMFSSSGKPHQFIDQVNSDLINLIINFFEDKIKLAIASGINTSQIILDPGMGAFLGTDPKLSEEVLESFAKFEIFNLPLMLGVSRKRFIGYSNLAEADNKSAEIAKKVWDQLSNVDLYVRCHNLETHRPLLK